ncbi:MAG: 3-oxoacyl-[acyl-carrier-protein] reductase [Bacillota bacterium]|nr:3-oxoacyl-[acyl-carrier-protein] reductase [Bacillota bacterium]
MSLEQKTALVTGGSRGIGREIALSLADNCAQVAILYAGRKDAADETVRELEKKNVKAMAVQCDVSDDAAVQAAFKQVKDAFGPIDILVNNAGITKDMLTLRMSAEDFAKVIAVNLNGAFHTIKACYRDFLKLGWGRILNISSVSGLMGNPGQANYASSKAGLIGLTKTVARELANRGVTVNAICPGFIETDMTGAMNEEVLSKAVAAVPMSRLGTPKDIAKAAAFLCSEDAGYITGAVLQVDGGMYM